MQHQRQDGPGGDQPADGSAGRSASSRRRLGLWGSVGAVAAVAIAVVVANVVGGDDDPPPVAEPEVVVLPSPTSTVTPVERVDPTAFLSAMPGTALQYGLTAVEPHEGLVGAGALEAWRLVYSDGQGGEVVVHAGQWRDAESAAAVMADVLALDAQGGAGAAPTDGSGDGPADATGGDESAASPTGASEGAATGTTPTGTATPEDDGPRLPLSGDVLVDGTATGTFHIRAGAAGGQPAPGTATAVWTNGTTFFQAEGPEADMPNFYAAFPL